MHTDQRNILDPESCKKTLAIVGVGLIGGSFAIAMKALGFASHVIGVDRSPESGAKALELGFIDEALPLEEAVRKADIIYVAIPVDHTVPTILGILDIAKPHHVIADAGSTKRKVCAATEKHPNRGRYVATHPMWGTEHSGPEAAVRGAFKGRACVICEKEKSDADALATMENLYQALGMNLVYMDGAAHDMHAAYISHISHITSFALANTVLEKEKEEKAIFDLAGGGFESTVRLAKSSPAMWAPIFIQNKENILDVLNEHVRQLETFRTMIEAGDEAGLTSTMRHANTIKRILK